MLPNHKTHQQTYADFQFLLTNPNIVCDVPYTITSQWLQQFAQNAVIPTNVEYQGNQRLGFYYQWLWQQLIIHHPDYSLVGEEIQLQWQQQTVGAIDFLVNNHKTNELEHWEVAIKFYLRYHHSWPGPNAKDQLDKKVLRMVEHQLQLTDHPAFQLMGNKKPSQRRLIIQGRLFDGWPEEQQGSNMIVNNTTLTGKWCYCSDAKSLHLKRLTKRQWICPPTFTELDQPLDLEKLTIPTQAIDSQNQIWFIVPNYWPIHNNNRNH